MDKEEMRAEIRSRIDAMSPERRKQEVERIHERLSRLPAFQNAESVLVYAATDEEVPTGSLIDQLLGEGAEVCVPRVVDGSLDAVPIESRDELSPGAFGVPEPSEGRPFDPRLLDLAIVPGLAFDHQGNRLGRGGGHFDRFLGEFHPLAIALAWECQILGRVPTEPHDEPVDLVVHAFGLEGRPTP